MTARRVLFVCTGNLCRSPMAEAMATARGGGDVTFESAGVRAAVGAPATPVAVGAVREIGIDLAGHRARQLDRDLAEAVDRIYVMTADHRAGVLEIAPGMEDRVFLLHPDGADIDDPFGCTLDVYREIRDEIAAAIEARGEDL